MFEKKLCASSSFHPIFLYRLNNLVTMKIFLRNASFTQNSFKILVSFFIVLSFFGLTNQKTYAQIFEPEGLNMPGAYNVWNNPPTLTVFASAAQAAGMLTRMSGYESVNLSYKWLKLVTLQKTGSWRKDRLIIKKATAISYLTHSCYYNIF